MQNRLYLGNRRYSSWSMRGWLAVRLAGLEVEDVVVPLGETGTPALRSLTPAGLVPVLVHNGLTIWDSLAICEYCAEQAPSLWPADPGPRSLARSVAAEMHAGFRDLRTAMPMNLTRLSPLGSVSASVANDIARIEQVWRECLIAHHGPYLLGSQVTVPDVMYAPVVSRFVSYGIALSRLAQDYCGAIRALPLVEQWYRLAAAEPASWQLAKYE